MRRYSGLSLETLARMQRHTERRMWTSFRLSAVCIVSVFLVGIWFSIPLFIALSFLGALVFGVFGVFSILGNLFEADI